MIRLRVTESEAEMFKSNARNAGCKSISEYIRERCIGESKDDSGVDKTAVKKAKKQKIK